MMTERPAAFTPEQMERYSRHLLLREVGPRGQRRLLASRVMVVGAGGLGCPVLAYLAAAGVGTLDVVDSDVVEPSNLQRQILHGTPDIGRPKTDSAREALAALNPDVRVVPHAVRLDETNAADLMAPADVVVDGSDNFATRYLVSDTARRLRKPLVAAALFRFEGQVTVFPNDGLPDSACYRCLFPTPPPPGFLPSCQEAGILGAVPGLLGSIQAAETLKVLLGIGESLAGRLLLVDVLAMEFRTVRLHRNPACRHEE